MAKEILVRDVLTEDMIEGGRIITKFLDEGSLNPTASFWYFYPEEKIWRLMIASKKINTEGPKKLYSRIREILIKIPENKPSIKLKDISLIKDNEDLLSLLRIAIRTGSGIFGIRFSRNSINGHFIEDSYIYRIL